MKKLVLLTLFSFSTLAFGQFTLEHTYTEGLAKRIKLEYSGEKYMVFDNQANQLIFYNADHSYWKTITLAMPSGSWFLSYDEVSEALINPDVNIEVVYSYSYLVNGEHAYITKVISEDGTELLSVANGYSTVTSKISGLPSKLIVHEFNGMNHVYALPGLTPEHDFPVGRLTRVRLENSGEKYYFYDLVNNDLKFYNADFSFWKTVNTPVPAGYNLYIVGDVSETAIIPDAQIEIAYSCEKNLGNGFEFESRIVNEAGSILLSVPDAGNISVNRIDGLENKISINKSIAGIATNNIYQVPSLALEHSYPGIATRIKLELSGEKYYTLPTPQNAVIIYNSDHSLWKTINLPVTDANYHIINISGISETKLNTNDLTEVIYTDEYVLGDIAHFPESRIADETGNVLLLVPDAPSLYLSEIEGGEKKLIAGADSQFSTQPSTQVYRFDDLAKTDFTKSTLSVYPNPVSENLKIQSQMPIVKLELYNITGVLATQAESNTIQEMNVQKFASGLYLLKLTDTDNHVTEKKILIR